MNRKLFSSIKDCPFNCKYCFTIIDNYRKQKVFDSFIIDKDFNVIYPSCDSEIIINNELLDFVEKSILIRDYTIISFSTKSIINNHVLEEINSINSNLISKNKGFIKISISITNKSMINELEPLASSFEERIEILKRLNNYNIPNSVILKPILPFIDIKEYKEIIDRAAIYTKYFLLGGLYISKKTEFYNKYIKGKYKSIKKTVEWLDYRPNWNCIESTGKIEIIKEYITKKNLKCFENDISILNEFKHNIVTEKVAYVY